MDIGGKGQHFRCVKLLFKLTMSQGRLADSPRPNRLIEWLLLVVELPGRQPKATGIILLDIADDNLFVELAEDSIEDEDLREVLAYFKEEIQERACEVGAKSVFDSLEQGLSLSIRIDGPRHQISAADPAQTLAGLFRQYVLERGHLTQGTH